MRLSVLRPLAGALLLALVLPGAASAHERRDVGKLQFVVGFIGEPAILGQPNGIDLRVTRKENSEPVEGLEKALKATIQSGGGQPKEFALRARFGMKGAYTADLIPTRAGAYVFTFTGNFEGQDISEKFESGPGRFNDVQDAAQLQFPEPVPFAGDLAPGPGRRRARQPGDHLRLRRDRRRGPRPPGRPGRADAPPGRAPPTGLARSPARPA